MRRKKKKRNGLREIPDDLWNLIEPLLPPDKPPGTNGRSRVANRTVLNGILYVLRTGCQWNALDATGICTSSSAHRRFQEWRDAGVFLELWKRGLLAYDKLEGLDWNWLSMDGAMTKAPLGGEKNRPQSYGSRQRRRQA